MSLEELIKRDYQACLNFIDKCDEHLFKIRNWTLLTVSAVIAFAYQTHNAWICLVGVFIVTYFFYLELVYKSFQDASINQTTDIDERYEKEIQGIQKDEIWKDYVIGMGRHIRRPSIKLLGEAFKNKDKHHILIIYAFPLIVSLLSFVIIT